MGSARQVADRVKFIDAGAIVESAALAHFFAYARSEPPGSSSRRSFTEVCIAARVRFLQGSADALVGGRARSRQACGIHTSLRIARPWDDAF